jgi:hypothetical protein
MTDLAFKTGRLTAEEQQYIIEKIKFMSVGEIAEALKRRTKSVEDFLRKIPAVKTEEVSNELKSSPIYKTLEKQFTPDELKQFIYEYNGYVKQFQGEILHSEQAQIADVIKMGILENRCLIEEKGMIDEITRLDMEIKKERLGANDPARLDELAHNMAMTRQLQAKNAEQYAKLNDAKLKGMQKLNATRDKREDARNVAFKTSFKDWMKTIIENQEMRRELGEYMEMMRIAADKEYARLTKPFKYADGMVDIPILNTETVKNLKEENADNGN